MVTNLVSISLPIDSHFSFYVLTTYYPVWNSTLRTAPSPPGCCFLSDYFIFFLRIFIVFIKPVDVLQFELGFESDNENEGFSYVYTTQYTYFDLVCLQSNTMSYCTNIE